MMRATLINNDPNNTSPPEEIEAEFYRQRCGTAFPDLSQPFDWRRVLLNLWLLLASGHSVAHLFRRLHALYSTVFPLHPNELSGDTALFFFIGTLQVPLTPANSPAVGSAAHLDLMESLVEGLTAYIMRTEKKRLRDARDFPIEDVEGQLIALAISPRMLLAAREAALHCAAGSKYPYTAALAAYDYALVRKVRGEVDEIAHSVFISLFRITPFARATLFEKPPVGPGWLTGTQPAHYGLERPEHAVAMLRHIECDGIFPERRDDLLRYPLSLLYHFATLDESDDHALVTIFEAIRKPEGELFLPETLGVSIYAADAWLPSSSTLPERMRALFGMEWIAYCGHTKFTKYITTAGKHV